DNYANLHSKEYSENKSFCEDLIEVLIPDYPCHMVQAGKHTGSFENTQKLPVVYLQEHSDMESESYKQIKALGGNPELVTLIEHLSKMYKDSES
ncbi:hypothetical protein lerEdw1_006259, partial [Lerista edwardsae]